MLSQIFLLSILLGITCCQPFSATIKTTDVYKLGDEITCKLTITNTDDSDFYLLRRNTPLEALSSNIFSLTKDGEKIKYDGLLYQRAPPTSDEYICIPSKSSISSVVELSRSYPIASGAQYTVKLESYLAYYKHDLANSSLQHISSNQQTFKVLGGVQAGYRLTQAERLRNSTSTVKTFLLTSVASSSTTYKTPAYTGTPRGNDVTSLGAVYDAAYNVLLPSAIAVNQQRALYNSWFGLQYKGYMDTVQGAYLNIKSAMERYQYTIYFDGPECANIANVIAYTYHGSTTIYVCSLYRNEPDVKGVNTKLGTIVHEFTHAVAYTEDIDYGQTACRKLAYNQPNEAIRNADNYHYFSEPLAQ